MLLTVNDIKFAYTDKLVLQNISFHVSEGDLFAILGPNAAGKTTLIKLLTGQLQNQEGHIWISGVQADNGTSIALKKEIGTMWELSGVYLKMTGYEYLSFIASLYNIPKEDIPNRIRFLAEKYKITDELHRKIGKYSMGTKKKVEFCAAIIHNPKLLFLDEPFESVDPSVTYEMKQFLHEYVQSGCAVIITSHILDIIQNLCNRYIIIDHGSVIDAGDVNDAVNLEARFMEVAGDGAEKQ